MEGGLVEEGGEGGGIGALVEQQFDAVGVSFPGRDVKKDDILAEGVDVFVGNGDALFDVCLSRVQGEGKISTRKGGGSTKVHLLSFAWRGLAALFSLACVLSVSVLVSSSFLVEGDEMKEKES